MAIIQLGSLNERNETLWCGQLFGGKILLNTGLVLVFIHKATTRQIKNKGVENKAQAKLKYFNKFFSVILLFNCKTAK